MYKRLYLIILISAQILAQNGRRENFGQGIVGQSIVQDTIVSTMSENKTGQSITQLNNAVQIVEHKEQQSNIDFDWQSLLKDLNGEPVVQDMAGKLKYKNETLNNTQHSMQKDLPSVLNLTVHLTTQDVASQALVKNTTETPLGLNITAQPQVSNKPGASTAQATSLQENKIQEQYQNVTTGSSGPNPDNINNTTETPLSLNITGQPQVSNKPWVSNAQTTSTQQKKLQEQYQNVTTGSFGPTLDHNYHSPYLDSAYKSSMPPIQTQEQWNATNRREGDGLSDDEKRQEDEYKQQMKRYKEMHEEVMNITTSCEEFLNNTVFDPEKVLDKDWQTIYFWNIRDEDPCNIRFSRPTQTMIKRFKDELHAEMKPPVDWSAAELFVETNVEYSALYVKTNVSGLYRAIPTATFQYFGIPAINYALKIVNDKHLGIVNCRAKQCYALCDVENLPQVEQIPEIAKSMGFYSPLNSSFIRVIPIQVPDDPEESMEDNFLGDFDTFNTDPLQIF